MDLRIHKGLYVKILHKISTTTTLSPNNKHTSKQPIDTEIFSVKQTVTSFHWVINIYIKGGKDVGQRFFLLNGDTKITQ